MIAAVGDGVQTKINDERGGPRQGRLLSLDALRGVAVLGIFVINILGYGLGEAAFYNPLVIGGDSVLDYGLWTFAQVFIEGSMRGLFTLLFGVSLMLFMARSPYPDGPIRGADLYLRRTFWLFVIGAVHAYVLLGRGDILMTYAIAGFVLFPLRILSARVLLSLAALLLTVFTLDAIDLELAEDELRQSAIALEAARDRGTALTTEDRATIGEWYGIVKGARPTPDELASDRADYTGDVASVYAANAAYVTSGFVFDDLVGWTLDAIMLMFVGMALYQLGLFDGRRSRRPFVVLALLGYGIGLGIRIWSITVRWQAEFSPALVLWPMFEHIARVALTLGHVGAFMLLWRASADGAIMRALAAAGRMALTNYVGQSVIANLVFSGVGFGLYGSVTFTEIYAIMAVILALQVVASVFWLRRYRFGPLEWLWRCLTYGQWFALRRQVAA